MTQERLSADEFRLIAKELRKPDVGMPTFATALDQAAETEEAYADMKERQTVDREAVRTVVRDLVSEWSGVPEEYRSEDYWADRILALIPAGRERRDAIHDL
jgi:hypothetical protein